MGHEARVPIRSDADIVVARQQGRTLGARLGFSSSDLTLIATAISELARNIVSYATRGEIIRRLVQQGIVIIAHDEGPGIPEVAQAMQDGYSTGNSADLRTLLHQQTRRSRDRIGSVPVPGDHRGTRGEYRTDEHGWVRHRLSNRAAGDVSQVTVAETRGGDALAFFQDTDHAYAGDLIAWVWAYRLWR
jgi:serine/threonine-protein kinase RsbT